MSVSNDEDTSSEDELAKDAKAKDTTVEDSDEADLARLQDLVQEQLNSMGLDLDARDAMQVVPKHPPRPPSDQEQDPSTSESTSAPLPPQRDGRLPLPPPSPPLRIPRKDTQRRMRLSQLLPYAIDAGWKSTLALVAVWLLPTPSPSASLDAMAGLDGLSRFSAWGFDLLNTHDIVVALALMTPLLALDAVLMLDSHHARKGEAPFRTVVSLKREAERTEEAEAAPKNPRADLVARLAPPPRPRLTVEENREGKQSEEATSTTTPSSSLASSSPPAPSPTTTSTPTASRSTSRPQSGTSPIVQPDSTILVMGVTGGAFVRVVDVADGRVTVDAVGSAVQGPLLRRALYVTQNKKTTRNPGIVLGIPLEGLVIVVTHLAQELFRRGTLLRLTAAWTLDRLFEAGLDETDLLMQQHAWLGLVAFMVAQCGWAVLVAAQEVEPPSRMGLIQDNSGMESATSAQKELSMAIEEAVITPFREARRLARRLEAGREVLDDVLLGCAFLATGNLAAPYAACVVRDVLFSFYQRRRLALIRTRGEKNRGRVEELMETLVPGAVKETETMDAETKEKEEEREKRDM